MHHSYLSKTHLRFNVHPANSSIFLIDESRFLTILIETRNQILPSSLPTAPSLSRVGLSAASTTLSTAGHGATASTLLTTALTCASTCASTHSGFDLILALRAQVKSINIKTRLIRLAYNAGLIIILTMSLTVVELATLMGHVILASLTGLRWSVLVARLRSTASGFELLVLTSLHVLPSLGGFAHSLLAFESGLLLLLIEKLRHELDISNSFLAHVIKSK